MLGKRKCGCREITRASITQKGKLISIGGGERQTNILDRNELGFGGMCSMTTSSYGLA